MITREEMRLDSLPQCPRCGIHTDCLYPMWRIPISMDQVRWQEVTQPDTLSDEILNKLERFCYKCCDELEGGL